MAADPDPDLVAGDGEIRDQKQEQDGRPDEIRRPPPFLDLDIGREPIGQRIVEVAQPIEDRPAPLGRPAGRLHVEGLRIPQEKRDSVRLVPTASFRRSRKPPWRCE
jgi:hypothetical protein